MAVDFPSSPTTGQTYTSGDRTWKYNGSAWDSITSSVAALTRIADCTVTSTGGTAATATNGVVSLGNGNTIVTISNAFSSTYANYLILVEYALAATGNPAMYLRMGTNALNYYGVTAYYAYDTSGDGTAKRNNSTEWNIGYVGANNYSATITVFAPQRSVNTSMSASFAGDLYYGTSNGRLSDATQYTSFSLLPASSSFASGTVRVYGYSN